MRIILTAEHASLRFGGEAALPVHYFAGLNRRGCDVWLITHERTGAELQALFPELLHRIVLISDSALHRGLWQITRRLPARLGYRTTGFLSRIATQLQARTLARRLVREASGNAVVHQVIPVSPREPSLLVNMGAPVVIGPMNGNLELPPEFGGAAQPAQPGVLTRLAHRLMPGKRRAALLLLANERSRAGLPPQSSTAQQLLAENGVDTRVWTAGPMPQQGPARFVFCGRLVGWKGAQYLPAALARMADQTAELRIIGEGPLQAETEARARALGVAHRVSWSGWLSQADCASELAAARALVLPSLMECGGAVVLEAMACARPAIATNWGGPGDYIVPGTGILVEPRSEEALIAGFAAAMDQLAAAPELAARLGAAARNHVLAQYDWDSKIETVLGFYAQAQLARTPSKR